MQMAPLCSILGFSESKQTSTRKIRGNVVNKGIIRDYMSASITEVSYRQPPLVSTLLVVGPS